MANKHASLGALFTDIADAIREVMGETSTIVADEFPDYIRKLTYIEPPTLLPNKTWYKGTTKRDVITTINIVNKYTPTGSETESWDASVAQDGGIKCYIAGTTLTIAGNGAGSIKANADSYRAFSNDNNTKLDFFKKVTAFNGLDLLDTSDVTNMGYMFFNFTALTTLDLSSFDTSKVKWLSYMFYHCDALIDLDLSGWSVGNVKGMSNMFSQCYKLANLDLSGWSVTSNLTDMSWMFASCHALTNLDLSNFDTSEVFNVYQMFYNCDGLTILDLSNFDTSKLTSIESMFAFCSSLTVLDLSGWDTTNITNMQTAFGYCNNLTTIYASSTWSMENCTKSTAMFANCTKLKGDIEYNSSYTDKTYAKTSGGYLTYKAAPTA